MHDGKWDTTPRFWNWPAIFFPLALTDFQSLREDQER